MPAWGGSRENAGRPAEFDERVSRIFYMDKSELESVQHWIEFVNEADNPDKKLTISNLARELFLSWVETQKERYKLHAERLGPGTS